MKSETSVDFAIIYLVEALQESKLCEKSNIYLEAALVNVSNKRAKIVVDARKQDKKIEGVKKENKEEEPMEFRNAPYQVGPFSISYPVEQDDLRLIQYLFDSNLDQSEVVVSFSNFYLHRSEFTTLRPRVWLDGLVIDMVVEKLTTVERSRQERCLNWYLLISFSAYALGDEEYFMEFVEKQKIRETYMSNLEECDKIFIPIHSGSNAHGHFYLYVVDVRKEVVQIWDSLPELSLIDIKEREKKVHCILLSLEALFLNDIANNYPKGQRFKDFDIRMAKNIPSQPNGYDCGIFVIKFMELAAVMKNSTLKFDSDEERFTLALNLFKDDMNKLKKELFKRVKRYQKESDEGQQQGISTTGRKKDPFWEYVDRLEGNYVKCKFCGNEFAGGASRIKGHLSKLKGHGVCTCTKVPEGVQVKASLTFNHSNTRVKSNYNSGNLNHNLPNLDLLSRIIKETVRGYKFPTTTDVIGEQFQEYLERLWQLLMADEVFVIGIWGMGGVGKTTLVKHLYNELIERVDVFDDVVWIDVSKDFSIRELQINIAKSIGLNLWNENGEIKAAARLLYEFEKRNKCVIILDDVWDFIFLQNMGIPLANKGIKLILTTRSFEMCQSMGCRKNIVKVEPLFNEDWNLFETTLEYDGLLPVEATLVLKKCEGLPLAIVNIATSMKGKKDIREWKSLLQKFEMCDNGLAIAEVEKRINPVLRASYDHLNDTRLQQCFLHVALAAFHSEGRTIKRDELTRNLIDEGLINAELSEDQQLDECHIILSKLYNNSLLQSLSKEDIKLHNMVWGMAVSIARENYGYSFQFLKMPCEHEGIKYREEAKLIDIKEVPSSVSSRCPKLPTLYLRYGHNIVIPDDFFINMSSLGVLDMTGSTIERLPNSLSDLESLTVLLLGYCRMLCYVPPLGKLQKLKRLDLSFTAITEVPLGLEMLVNLTYLNLKRTSKLKMEGASVVSQLNNLQSLIFDYQETTGLLARDVQVLPNLKTISVGFCEWMIFNAFVSTIQNINHGLRSYALCFHNAKFYDHGLPVPYGSREKKAVLKNCDLNTTKSGAKFVLPVDVNTLDIARNEGWRCLCDAIEFDTKYYDDRTPMECFIIGCYDMECLFCFSGSFSFCSTLQLKKLNLSFLSGLTALYEENKWAATCLPPLRAFSDLKYLSVISCDNIKKLLTPELSAHLPNLEKLFVSGCESMEEIFSTRATEYDESLESVVFIDVATVLKDVIINLPRLKRVALNELRNLKSVCKGIMSCASLISFTIYDCPNLKMHPRIHPHFEIKVTDRLMGVGYLSDSDEECI